MPFRRALFSLVIIIMLTTLSVGCFQPAGDQEVARQKADAQAHVSRLATEAFERGMKLFEAGDWEKAIREFEIAQAYDRSDPRYAEMILKAREQRGTPPPGTYRLVYKFNEGDSWSYRTTATINGALTQNVRGKPASPVQVTGRFSARVFERVLQSREDGSAEIEARYEDVQSTINGDLVESPWIDSGLAVKMIVSREGLVRSVELKGGEHIIPGSSGGPFDRPIFPGRPLKPGDEWTDTEGQNFGGSGARQERFTFASFVPEVGPEVARITGTTQDSFVRSYGPRGDLRGKVQMNWTVLFDVERGRMLEAVGQGTLQYGWHSSGKEDWSVTFDLRSTTQLES